MADYRQIHTKIWKDTWFIDLEPDEKLLFIYLFGNERASVAGIYELPKRVMAFETGMELGQVNEILDKFTTEHKVIYENGIVWVVNLRKYNANPSPKVAKRIELDLATIPESTIKQAYIQYQADGNTVWIQYPEPDDEHDQEHKQHEDQEDQEEQESATPSAVADTPTPVTPTNCQEWLDWLDRTANHPALVQRMIKELYPKHEPPDFGYIGKVAKQAGTGINGYRRLMTLLWQNAAAPPTGDILPYMTAILKRDRNGQRMVQRGESDAIVHTGLDAPDPPEQPPPEQTEGDRIWTTCLIEFQAGMEASMFNRWLRGTRLEVNDGLATVVCRDSQAQEWCDHRLRPVIERTVNGVAGRPMNVAFTNGGPP